MVATNNPSPLFIVGSPRSGTSILTMAVRAAGYNGFNEGNFLGWLWHMHRVTDNYFNAFGTSLPQVMMSRIDRKEFKGSLSDLVKRIVDRENPVAPWFDKTGNPDTIKMIPELLDLWPTACFVFAKRRGIENIVSRVRKFPGHNFEYHCRDWAANMAAWRAVRHDLPNLRCLEVDQQDLVQNVVATAARLAAFLHLSAEQEGRVAAVFRKERPQQTAAGTTERVLTLRTAGWSPPQVDLFMQHCKEEMDRFGYSLDETYRTPEFAMAP